MFDQTEAEKIPQNSSCWVASLATLLDLIVQASSLPNMGSSVVRFSENPAQPTARRAAQKLKTS